MPRGDVQSKKNRRHRCRLTSQFPASQNVPAGNPQEGREKEIHLPCGCCCCSDFLQTLLPAATASKTAVVIKNFLCMYELLPLELSGSLSVFAAYKCRQDHCQ